MLRLPRVAALLFCSGACALIYQIAWFRELRLIFGASTAASAAVLAVFMGGLGLGGARLGRVADRVKSPLGLYANLELVVAATAALTPGLVWLADVAYLASGGATTLGATGATLLRLVLGVVVLGPSTIAMGGTLPAAARAVELESDHDRRRVATLYGVNTFGAVVGTVLANFVLLEVFGTRTTLWVAALVNALVGMAARSLARTAVAPPAEPAEQRQAVDAEPASPVADAATAPGAAAERAPWFPPAAAALAGFAFMLMELTWYRMLAPLLGGTSYTLGLILAVALVGIGLGGALYARTRTPATLRFFAATCSAEALFIAIPFALGDRLAVFAALLRPFSRIGFGPSIAVWAIITSIVVLPAAIVAGAQFPLIIALYGRSARTVGRDVGNAYLANTLGSIVGSLAGGFGLIPLLGGVGCWRLVIVALVAGALVALVVDGLRGTSLRARAKGLVLALVPGVLLVVSTGPTDVWRHSGIGAGRADAKLEPADRASVARFVRGEARAVRWQEDGVESSVALNQQTGFNFIVNGKSDGHVLIDASTQVMAGLLGAMLHGAPKRLLVIGLGTGSTAGWLGAIPGVETVDVAELEPAILRVARDCAPVNQNVLDNPKVKIHLGDARELLRTSRGTYDFIFSEPSNPYRAGISSLYTEEFYHAVEQRLGDGGLFLQWIQAYEVDGWAVGTAVVTMKRVFPEVAIWETARGDLLLVAQRKHVPIDVERLRTLLAQEPYSSAARLVWRTSSPEGVLAHHVASSKLADAIVERQLGTVNTDDQNLLEFAFARSVGERRRVDVEVNELALRLRMSEADLSTPVDWRQVIEERWLMQESGSTERLVPPPSSRPDIPLGRVIELHRDGDCAGVLRVWKRLGRKPRSSGEGALLAECAARAGTEDDAHLMESGLAHERALIDAIWRGRHGDVEGTIESLFRGFTELQTVPWPRLSLSRAALARAVDLSAKDPRIARIFYDVLKKPFAVEALREERLIAALRTAASTGDAALCVEALAPLEPPPLEKRTLEQRLQCYTTANHPLRGAAEKDLTELMAHETAFGASIASPPRPPHAPKVDPIEPADTIPEAPLVEADAGPSDAGPSDAGAGARDAAPRDAQP